MKRLAALLAVSFIAGAATAQTYPSKPITLVVPLAIGSTADIVSRTVGAELAKNLGQPVIVDNRPGAGGTIAMQQVARAAPDGYTIAFASNGTHAINIALYSKPGYDPVKDFTPITAIGEVSNIMIVHPSNPAKNAQEVIALAKAKPGTLNFAVSGVGGANQLAGIDFALRTGIKWTYIPYKGGSQAIADVVGGQAESRPDACRFRRIGGPTYII